MNHGPQKRSVTAAVEKLRKLAAEVTNQGWSVDVGWPFEPWLTTMFEDIHSSPPSEYKGLKKANAPDDWDFDGINYAFDDFCERLDEVIVTFCDTVAHPAGNQAAFSAACDNAAPAVHEAFGGDFGSLAGLFRPFWNAHDLDLFMKAIVNDSALQNERERVDETALEAVAEQCTVDLYALFIPKDSGDVDWVYENLWAARERAGDSENASLEGYGIYEATASFKDWKEADGDMTSLDFQQGDLVEEEEAHPTPYAYFSNGSGDQLFVLEGREDEPWKATEYVSWHEAERRQVQRPSRYQSNVEVIVGEYATKEEAAHALLDHYNKHFDGQWSPILFSDNAGNDYKYLNEAELQEMAEGAYGEPDPSGGIQMGLPGLGVKDAPVRFTGPQPGDIVIEQTIAKTTATWYTSPSFHSRQTKDISASTFRVWQHGAKGEEDFYVADLNTFDDVEAAVREWAEAHNISRLPTTWLRTIDTSVDPPTTTQKRTSIDLVNEVEETPVSTTVGALYGRGYDSGLTGSRAGPESRADRSFQEGYRAGIARRTTIREIAYRDAAEGRYGGDAFSAEERNIYISAWRGAQQSQRRPEEHQPATMSYGFMGEGDRPDEYSMEHIRPPGPHRTQVFQQQPTVVRPGDLYGTPGIKPKASASAPGKMRKYKVKSLDVWGGWPDECSDCGGALDPKKHNNECPHCGDSDQGPNYEINNWFDAGEIEVPENATDEQIVDALIDSGHLNSGAKGKVTVDSPYAEGMDIIETDSGEPLYQLEPGEEEEEEDPRALALQAAEEAGRQDRANGKANNAHRLHPYDRELQKAYDKGYGGRYTASLDRIPEPEDDLQHKVTP